MTPGKLYQMVLGDLAVIWRTENGQNLSIGSVLRGDIFLCVEVTYGISQHIQIIKGDQVGFLLLGISKRELPRYFKQVNS